MALQAADLITRPFDRQYGLAGVRHACDTLTRPGLRLQHSPAGHLRQMVSDVAFEMALRRWLEQARVDYGLPSGHLAPARPYVLTLGGRRCALQATLLTETQALAALQHDPAWLLDSAALVTLDALNSQHLGEKDIYIFGVVAAPQIRDSARPDAQQPLFLTHILPWQRWDSRAGQLLSPLRLQAAVESPLTLQLGGLGRDRQPLQAAVTLQTAEPLTPPCDFSTLVYLQTARRPRSVVEIHSLTRKLQAAIAPSQWHDIWLAAEQIVLLGWLNKHDFRANSRVVHAGEYVKPHGRLPSNSRALAVAQLRPLQQLADIARSAGRN